MTGFYKRAIYCDQQKISAAKMDDWLRYLYFSETDRRTIDYIKIYVCLESI